MSYKKSYWLSKKMKRLLDSYGLKKLYNIKFLKNKPSNKVVHLLNGYCIAGPIDQATYKKTHDYKISTSKKYQNKKADKITLMSLNPPLRGLKKHRSDKCLKNLILSCIHEKKNQ